MKTIILKLVKKNRKYWACETEGGCPAHLIINNLTDGLVPGQVELVVEDKSIRSKYGTKLVFEAVGGGQGRMTYELFRHFAYNSKLVSKLKALGGRYDKSANCWAMPSIVADKVVELDDLWNDEIVTVEITAKRTVSKCCGPVALCGYTIARAYGRDSGAKLGDGVSQLRGNVESGGSIKNWDSIVTEGSVLRLNVPRKVLEKYGGDQDDFDIKIIQ